MYTIAQENYFQLCMMIYLKHDNYIAIGWAVQVHKCNIVRA